MKLKKLDLYGFKSFAERTAFEFEDSLSALVGPNGSGKSNVADAIKWVLGERSAQKLRGSEMANVIFDGSSSRKPLNFADVRLTIDNSDGWLPVDYEEVTIRRRVDRTGRSDYYINDQQCRLKDIRRLLLDTGIGSSSYSFIEQGQIDQLLRASPKERRSVFEEAAGINRFLEQKREAERKLERVTDNLARVGDIIEEVEHQLRSVKYQAGRARTFKRQMARLQRLRLANSLHQKRHLESARRDYERRIQEANARKQAVEQKADAAAEALQTARTELDAARDESGECRQQLTRVRARLESLKREVDINQRRRRELEEQLSDLSARRARLERQIGEIDEEHGKLNERLRRSAEELERNRAQLDTQRERLSDVRARLQRTRERLEERKGEVFELFERETHLKNQLEVLSAEERTLENRRDRLRNRRREVASQLESAEAEWSQTREKLEILQAREASLTGESAELERRLARARNHLEETSAAESQAKANLSGKVGRRDVLRDLEARGAGVRSGVRTLLEADPPGLVGLIARLLDAPLELAPAVDAVLAERAQALVFGDAASARDALALLSDGSEGRAELIVLDRLRPRTATPGPSGEAVQGRLSELVRCDGAGAPAVTHLLENAYLVEDREAAFRLLEQGVPGHVRLVTRAGECFGANGVWTGGTPEKPSLISRRSELAALDAEVRELEQELHRLQEEKSKAGRRARDLEAEREATGQRLEALRRSATDVRSHMEATERRVEALRRDLDATKDEEAALRRDAEELHGRKASVEEKLEGARRERASAESLVEGHKQALAELQEDEQELAEQINALGTEVARTRERHDGLEDLLRRLESDRERTSRQLEEAESEHAANMRRADEAQEAIRKATEENEQLRQEEEALREARQKSASAVQELQTRIEETAERCRGLAEEREEAEERLQSLRLQQNETGVKLQDLLERTAEDYGVHLEKLQREPEAWRQDSPFLTRQIREWAPERAPRQQVASWYREAEPEDEQEDEMELISLEEAVALRNDVLQIADDSSTDWQKVKEEISTLKAKVDRVGNVNVAAIRQQEELEVRLQFLTDQKEDLEKARRHEREIIRRLNRKSRESFQETFEQVRTNFQALFRKLFGGGSADLVLDPEEEDILEAGIEITARPPGKQTNSISLLSGGEKALATIALLFAMFQAKPSPFCLLDEVDAPLDDNNIQRFLMLLEEFRRDTQFIIVTHNKLTMSVAQVLYGITMTDGVTKKISVRFEEVDEHLESESPPRARAG